MITQNIWKTMVTRCQNGLFILRKKRCYHVNCMCDIHNSVDFNIIIFSYRQHVHETARFAKMNAHID